MTNEKISEGLELKKLIEVTERAIESLSKICNEECIDKKKYKDGVYSLNISENSDGSGNSAHLSRYYGNEKLLNVIMGELNLQVSEFKKMFEEL